MRLLPCVARSAVRELYGQGEPSVAHDASVGRPHAPRGQRNPLHEFSQAAAMQEQGAQQAELASE